MDMKKERMMILDMIAEGKITAADGEQLFKALDQSLPEAEASLEEGTFFDEKPAVQTSG